MPNEPIIQRAFAGGELAPALHARADLTKYLTGLRTARNWIVLSSGGVANRSGLRFVAPTKEHLAGTRLRRYEAANPNESVLVELGSGYMRFFQGGAAIELAIPPDPWDSGANYVIGDLVEEGGVNYYAVAPSTNQAPPDGDFWYALEGDIYELPNPFGEIPYWEQSGSVVTLTSQNGEVYELIFEALTRWILRPVSFTPTITPVTAGLSFTAGAAGTVQHAYVIGAVNAEGEESLIGGVVSGTSDVPSLTAPNVIGWTAVADAVEYYVYKARGGHAIYGYIGSTATNQFKDHNIEPDYLVTPPTDPDLFDGLLDYPAVSGTYQQRRLFGNSRNNPEAIWGSRIGLTSLFTSSTPLQDDDAITFRLAGTQYHSVRHLIGLKSLIVCTIGGAWRVGGPGIALTPGTLPADRETYTGFSTIKPVIVGNAILYVEAREKKLFDLRFDQQVEGLNGRDLTLFAGHLFKHYTLRAIDYQENPDSTVWVCRSDGTLLGLTYVRDQDVSGWHQHTTAAGGIFEDVCVVPEAGEDVVYVLVRRTIGEDFVRYIERLETRDFAPAEFDERAFFVDSGLSYSGAPVDVVSGLDHLEGEVVAVVADGEVIYNGDPDGEDAAAFTVTGGEITLPAEYSEIHVGLQIQFADIETLDLDVQGTDLRDRKKRVGSVTLLLDRSSRTFKVGPDTSHLVDYVLAPHETADVDEFTGQVELSLPSTFGNYGRLVIRQTDPLPITIIGIIPNVEVGG